MKSLLNECSPSAITALSCENDIFTEMFEITWHMFILTLPLPSCLVPTPFTKEGGGGGVRNVKVVYIVFTWLP